MIYGAAELDCSDVIPTAISIAEKYVKKERAKGFAEGVVKKGNEPNNKSNQNAWRHACI